jgi:hypothetical protein
LVLRISRLFKLELGRFSILVLAAAVVFPTFDVVSAQEQKKEQQEKSEEKVPTEKDLKQKKEEQAKPGAPTLSPAEALTEVIIYAYGGRKALETARVAIVEEGNIRLATDQGDITGTFSLRSIRRDKSWLDLLRTDLELNTPETAQRQGAPKSIRYVIAHNGATVWSAQNDQYTNPRPEAEGAFRAILSHEYTTLLRYKEDGSKLELQKPETVTGIQANVIDLTTPDGKKTRFWVSTKTYRILHSEYELKLSSDSPGIKYRISYYYTPWKVVQNTVVPARRVMTQDGKFVQEINLTNIVYSAKLDPEIFQHLQS